MRNAITIAVLTLATILAPTVRGITFGEWASNRGWAPGAVMPAVVSAAFVPIDSLSGISDYDWTTTPTTFLQFVDNRIENIQAGDFNGPSALTKLELALNPLRTIRTDAFSGLTSLEQLYLNKNALTSIEASAFNGLSNLKILELHDNSVMGIQAGAFDGLSNLKSLNLNHNWTLSLQAGTFSGLTSLTQLSLPPISSIEPGAFSGLTSLPELALHGYDGVMEGPLTTIPAGAFDGLTNLKSLDLYWNQISAIEAGAFRGLGNLTYLNLGYNPLTELNLAKADFSSLSGFFFFSEANVTRVSFASAKLNQTSLVALLNPDSVEGIGSLASATSLNLSGVDFTNITDLAPLYVLYNLTELWLVNSANLDPVDLDMLLDNLATIEGTAVEGLLYMTEADFTYFNTTGGGLLAAWDAEPGHHVVFVGIPEPATWILCSIILGGCVITDRHNKY